MSVPTDPNSRAPGGPPAARAHSRRQATLSTSVALGIALIASVAAACATSDPGPVDPANDPEWRRARIEDLRRVIAEDHATLEAMITRPGGGDTTALHEDSELRAIALRLGSQEDELDRLEARENEALR